MSLGRAETPRSVGFGYVVALVLVLAWSFTMLVTEQTAVAVYFGLLAVVVTVLRGQRRE